LPSRSRVIILSRQVNCERRKSVGVSLCTQPYRQTHSHIGRHTAIQADTQTYTYKHDSTGQRRVLFANIIMVSSEATASPPGSQHSVNPPPTEMRRRNGWERPFHSLQIASWVVFSFLWILFYTSTMPLIPEENSIRLALALVHTLSVIVVVVSAFVAVSSNPEDEWLTTKPNEIVDGSPFCFLCNQK
jgi:hypothetical protein